MPAVSPLTAYHELSYYTLSHPDPSFIHQHIVDTFAAQTADKNTKSITITFALIGLYLQVEKKFSGKQVQRVHMLLAQKKKIWPAIALPRDRGDITVFTLLQAKPGLARGRLIKKWCASVWQVYQGNREQIIQLLSELD